MKYTDYKEKRARFDPIEWSKCNICKEKYPNDEIIQHIHQKHPDKDCSTYNCWTCGIQIKKEREMKRHMKTVKHQLEVKKLTEEEMLTETPERSTQIQLILVTDEETEKSTVSQEFIKQDEIRIEIYLSLIHI